jgi:hypothetical protein
MREALLQFVVWNDVFQWGWMIFCSYELFQINRRLGRLEE